MPFADKNKQREYARAYEKRRYAEDSTYREARKKERRERGKAKYQSDPEYRARYIERQRELRQNPETKRKRNEYTREYRKTYDYRKILRYMASARAKKAGVPFDLSLDDIVIPERCPVLGVVLIRGVGKATDNSPSIDRMNPALGYVRGNVTVVSWRANRIKNDGTAEEHEAIARFMRSHLTP